MEVTRKNTVKIAFGSSAKAPKHLDVLRFVARQLDIPADSVHSVYKDENDHAYYIKFLDENVFNCFATGLEEQYGFEYEDGSRISVRIEIASSLFRYVRIFNLPPEVDDKDISAVLSQFGTIRQHVREKYPVNYGYSVFSGIRGAHMEISKEIPANLYIGHFKARIFYEGLKNRCFYCKSEEHQKVNCPKLASVKAAQDGALYSDVLSTNGAGPSSRTASDSLKLTSIPVPIRPTLKPASKESGETMQPGEKENTVSDEVEMADVEGGVSGDPRNPLKRPTALISRNDSSESDEVEQKKEKGKPKKKQQVMVSDKTVSPIDSIGARVGSRTRSGSATGKKN